MITVTGVKLSTDLSVADVRYTVLGGPAERAKAEHRLQSARGFNQRQLARVLSMRRTPTLRFHYDESVEEAARLDRLIAGALERDREIHEQGRASIDPASLAAAAPTLGAPTAGVPESDEPEESEESGEPDEDADEDEDPR